MESIDLITASILSKKLASGLEALVLDVKHGSGAFMRETSAAEGLAGALVEVANGAGCKTGALLTDMNEPLASAAGNALEVANACAFLTGHEIDGRLWDVTVALGGAALALAGLAADERAGAAQISEAFQNGRAAERFQRMVAALGGPGDFIERWAEMLPAAPVVRDVFAPERGFVSAIDARAVGLAVIGLGGGRRQASDEIDLATGFDQLAGLGALAGPEAPIARVHAQDENAAEAAAEALRAAYVISDTPPEEAEPVTARIGL